MTSLVEYGCTIPIYPEQSNVQPNSIDDILDLLFSDSIEDTILQSIEETIRQYITQKPLVASKVEVSQLFYTLCNTRLPAGALITTVEIREQSRQIGWDIKCSIKCDLLNTPDFQATFSCSVI